MHEHIDAATDSHPEPVFQTRPGADGLAGFEIQADAVEFDALEAEPDGESHEHVVAASMVAPTAGEFLELGEREGVSIRNAWQCGDPIERDRWLRSHRSR